MTERILGSMCIPGDLWRIDAVTERGQHWYRLWHGERILEDRLAIGSLEYFLRRYGVATADFVEDQPA